MNWDEPRRQYTFKTKEAAKAFLNACKSSRTKGRPVLRKSLPEFKHHANPGWSVFVTPWALPDAAEIARFAKELGGRKWGNQYIT